MMRILLDTHLYLWCVVDEDKLPARARQMISQAEKIYVSSVSIWEAAIKIKLGKLEADLETLMQEINAIGFSELPLTTKHVAQVPKLLNIHRDPFDRILIAQSIAEPLKFLTSDAKLKAYSDIVELV